MSTANPTKMSFPILRAIITLVLTTSIRAAELTPGLIDFGVQPQHAVLRREVILRNDSPQPLEILNIQTDCGCTVATPSVTRLSPSEQAVLQIELKTLEVRGDLRRQVVVTTNQGRHVIPVRALVNPFAGWTVEPQTIAFPPGEPDGLQEIIVSIKHASARVSSVWSPFNWLTVDFDASTSSLRVARKAGATAGALSGFVKVRTSDPTLTEFSIPAFASVRSGLQVNPSPLMLGTTRQGQPKTLRFTLAGWSEPEAPQIVVPNGTVVLQSTEGGQRVYDVTLAARDRGLVTADLYIFTANSNPGKDAPLMSVPVVLRVLPPL